MSATHLYDIWFRQVRKLLPNERVTRRRTLVWMIVGMYQSQSMHLSKIAAKMPTRVRRRSTVQRFSRFLQNEHFHVRRWYQTVAQQLLQVASQSTVHLIVDCTKIGTRHQLLMVARAYRKRALPIAWAWVKSKRGHSGADKQLALLRYIHELLPDEAQVILVGDCEFGAVALLKQLDHWGWKYVLRQPSNTKVCVSAPKWCSFIDLVPARNKLFWYPHAIMTVKHLYHTSLLALWLPGEDDPWLLATNMCTAREASQAYRRRMWIEEMFGDWKGHGVDLEKTRLRHIPRLSRLVFVVAVLYLWLISRGSQTIKNSQRHLVDRKSRRDLSIFRIGLDMIDYLCACDLPFSVRLTPYWETVG